MSTALKCDRCKNYFDYKPDDNNFIAFGHKEIVVGRNFPVKDICPNCMKQFTKWFESPDNYDPHDLIKNVDEEFQKASEAIKTYAEYKDPCDDCTIDIGQRRCTQCRYGYISVEDRKKKYAEDKIEPKLSDPYEEGGL